MGRGRRDTRALTKPQLWIVAGPNGAGKTTLVTQRLAERLTVVNPDVIAQQLPRIAGRLDERGAGQIAIERRNALLARQADLAIETTLSGSSAIRFAKTAKALGYKLSMIYVGLTSAEASLHRVLDRVGHGGHSVPVDAIRRRYPDSLAKLGQALDLVDRAYVFDNSGDRRRLLLIRDQGRVKFLARDLPRWARIGLAGVLPTG